MVLHLYIKITKKAHPTGSNCEDVIYIVHIVRSAASPDAAQIQTQIQNSEADRPEDIAITTPHHARQ